jgi:uncharacterized protein YegL
VDVEGLLVDFHAEYCSGTDYALPIDYPTSPNVYAAWAGLGFAVGGDVALVVSHGASEVVVQGASLAGQGATWGGRAVTSASVIQGLIEDKAVDPGTLVEVGLTKVVIPVAEDSLKTKIPGVRSLVSAGGVVYAYMKEGEEIASLQQEQKSYLQQQAEVALISYYIRTQAERTTNLYLRYQYLEMLDVLMDRAANIRLYQAMILDEVSEDVDLWTLDIESRILIPGETRIPGGPVADLPSLCRQFVLGLRDLSEIRTYLKEALSTGLPPGAFTDDRRILMERILTVLQEYQKKTLRFGGAPAEQSQLSSYTQLVEQLQRSGRLRGSLLHLVGRPDGIDEEIRVSEWGILQSARSNVDKESVRQFPLANGSDVFPYSTDRVRSLYHLKLNGMGKGTSLEPIPKNISIRKGVGISPVVGKFGFNLVPIPFLKFDLSSAFGHNLILPKEWSPPSWTTSEWKNSLFIAELYKKYQLSKTLPPPTPIVQDGGRKLVVFIHGWLPSGAKSPYTGSGDYATLWEQLKQDLTYRQGWQGIAYDWHGDASTGSFVDQDTVYFGQSGTRAAEAGYVHGWHLASLLLREYPHVEQVQFIAHSAGSWVARSAALGIRHRLPDCLLQVTLLDPYIPRGFQDGSDLNQALMEHLDRRKIRLENYYVHKVANAPDLLPDEQTSILLANMLNQARSFESLTRQILGLISISGTGVVFRWDRRHRQLDISEVTGETFTLLEAVEAHRAPLRWYSGTMNTSYVPSEEAVGYANSLPVLDGLRHVVFLVDTSGSMKGVRLKRAKQALHIMLPMMETLSTGVSYEVVEFDNHARSLISPRMDYPPEVAAKVDALRAVGGTEIERALRTVWGSVASTGRQGMVLLITDGESDPVSSEMLRSYRNASFPVHIVQVQDGGPVAMLESIAQQTGGTFLEIEPESLSNALMAGFDQSGLLSLLASVEDHIRQDEVKHYDLQLPVPGDLHVSVSWGGSRIGVAVESPRGERFSMANPGPVVFRPNWKQNIVQAVVPDAEEGVWRVWTKGLEIPDGGEAFSVSGSARMGRRDPLRLGYLGRTTPGGVASLSVAVPEEMTEHFDIAVEVRTGDQNIKVPLNDNRNHGDKDAGDGVHSVSFRAPETVGYYPLIYTIRNRRNGASQQRIGTLTVGERTRIQEGASSWSLSRPVQNREGIGPPQILLWIVFSLGIAGVLVGVVLMLVWYHPDQHSAMDPFDSRARVGDDEL